MFSYRSTARSVVSAATFTALTLGLAACGTEPVTDLSAGDKPESASKQPAEFSLTGAPSFMLPPHARTSGPEGTAKLPNGYAYAYGQLNEEMSFAVYSYFSDDYHYVSNSIWGLDGSSVSQSMDVAADGSQWIQNGSYDMGPDYSSEGSYITTQISAKVEGMPRVSTLYLTDFKSSMNESEYSSTVDMSNTSVSPDFDYYSLWTPEESYSVQRQARPDGSTAQCEYTYSSATSGGGAAGAVQEYTSTQACDDSNLAGTPDFVSSIVSSYDYNTGIYTSSGVASCKDAQGAERSLEYSLENGWRDENGAALQSPRDVCAFSGFNAY